MSFLLTICLFTVSHSSLTDFTLKLQYSLYTSTYAKSYPESSLSSYISNFQSSLLAIESINASQDSFKLSLNEISDLDVYLLGSPAASTPFTSTHPIFSTAGLPDSIDWVKAGKLTPQRTMNACKASWAFAALDTIESLISITQKTAPVVLSAEQIISCSDPYGNEGCTSGSLNSTYSYAEDYGLCQNTQFPFVDKVVACKKRLFCSNQISGFNMVTPNNELQLKAAVAVQPIAVTLNLTSSVINYKSGVLTANWCGTGSYQANFVIVGYGSVGGTDYWVVRSYFGTSWGLLGYGLIERNDNNIKTSGACGIAAAPYYPTFTQ